MFNYFKMKKHRIYVVPLLSESVGKCTVCGRWDELRPYGENGAKICFDCGMVNEQQALQQFKKQFK